MSDFTLEVARYGKDKVRLFKIVRDGKWHTAIELTVKVMLEGDIATSYTKADNSVVVATDTTKNTVYILAKKSSNVNTIELFAQEITAHFLATYSHLSTIYVDITRHRWTRIMIDGALHPHSFVRDGDDVQTTSVTQYRSGELSVTSGLSGLLVLKTTGSAFHGFIRDKYTTLPETHDRVFSTSVDATWKFATRSVEQFRKIPFAEVSSAVRDVTLEVFATDDSASVQATMYKMCVEILKRYGVIEKVSYSLPNKHYFAFDLARFGLKNEGKDQDIFYPVADPSGLITGTVTRKNARL